MDSKTPGSTGWGQWLLAHFEEVLAAFILAFEVALAFTNVVTRYYLKAPLAFMEELEVHTFVWLTMLGTAIAFRQRAHLNMVFFVQRLPPQARRVAISLTYIATVLLFGALFFLSLVTLQQEILLGTVTESLGIPHWWFTIGVPIGCILVIVRALQAAREE